MQTLDLCAHAKINLSLDVCGRRPDGYHRIDMILHMIRLHDSMSFRWEKEEACLESADEPWIRLDPGKPSLPAGKDNLIVQAALAMKEEAKKRGVFPSEGCPGRLSIDVTKNIPVAAGLAGGSANAAATLLALDHLWGMELSLAELCQIATEIGADVPFALLGTAALNPELDRSKDPLAAVCARAQGIGEELTKLPALEGFVALSKPPIGISTAQAYQGVDEVAITKHPDVSAQAQAICQGNRQEVHRQMINVLEEYTLLHHQTVRETKEKIKAADPTAAVMMSGSGPTIFALTKTASERDRIVTVLHEVNDETYATELATGYQPN